MCLWLDETKAATVEVAPCARNASRILAMREGAKFPGSREESLTLVAEETLFSRTTVEEECVREDEGPETTPERARKGRSE